MNRTVRIDGDLSKGTQEQRIDAILGSIHSGFPVVQDQEANGDYLTWIEFPNLGNIRVLPEDLEVMQSRGLIELDCSGPGGVGG